MYTPVSTNVDPDYPFRQMPSRKSNSVIWSRRRRLVLSYAPDWLITIVLGAIFFSMDFVDGYRRVFSLTDTSLRHPHAVHERVPNLALYLICGAAPFLIQIVINLSTIRSWWDFHNGTLGLVLGLSLTGSITQFVKITVGRPRPDILDRCQPPPGLADPEYGLTSWHVCTTTDNTLIRDGFRSFPSGHSSLSFAGLGFLAFYTAGKLHLFDERGHAGKAWLSLTPFAGAAMVAVSRTMDYRHHWHDVLVGSLLGTVMAYFAYRQYYPALSSELSHRPFSPRIRREQPESLPMQDVRPSMNGSRPEPARRYSDHPPIDSDLDVEAAEGSNRLRRVETVKRPGPGPLRDVWKEGEADDFEGFAPDDGSTLRQ